MQERVKDEGTRFTGGASGVSHVRDIHFLAKPQEKHVSAREDAEAARARVSNPFHRREKEEENCRAEGVSAGRTGRQTDVSLHVTRHAFDPRVYGDFAARFTREEAEERIACEPSRITP